LAGGAQRTGDVSQIRFGHESDRRGAGVDERGDLRILLHRDARLAGRAEGREPGVMQLELTGGAGEELRVPRDGTGPPALDVGDAELVEMPGDGELVGDRQREALLLGAVAQRGVVEVEGADRRGGRGV